MLERLITIFRLWQIRWQLDNLIKKNRILRNERLVPLLLSYPDERIRLRGKLLLASHCAAVQRVAMDLTKLLPYELVCHVLSFLA